MGTSVFSVSKDPDALAAKAADLIIQSSNEVLKSNDHFTIALAGGSTPERAYRLLAQSNRSARMDWTRTLVFFGDERFVPHGDARSNFAMAYRSLLAHVPVPPGQVFPIPTQGGSPAEGAAAYAATLAKCFLLPVSAGPPRFDLILLGLGDDGHTASLFPGAAALQEDKAWVTWSPPGTLPPPVDRITLTFPVLNAARRVLFLVSGSSKAEPLRDVLEGRARPDERPAAGVHAPDGILTWLVDEPAARLLKRP